mgnify:CR=1 FL=1
MATISKYISSESKEDIDILCFPKCSVTGYVRDFSTVDQEPLIFQLDNVTYIWPFDLPRSKRREARP